MRHASVPRPRARAFGPPQLLARPHHGAITIELYRGPIIEDKYRIRFRLTCTCVRPLHSVLGTTRSRMPDERYRNAQTETRVSTLRLGRSGHPHEACGGHVDAMCMSTLHRTTSIKNYTITRPVHRQFSLSHAPARVTQVINLYSGAQVRHSRFPRFRLPPTPAFHRGWHFYRSAQHNTATVETISSRCRLR